MPAVHAIRQLPVALFGPQLKACAYQFNLRSSGETDIDIDELGGRTVLLRASSDAILERDFELLLTIVAEAAARREPAVAPRERPAIGPSMPSKPPTRPAALLRSDAFMAGDEHRLTLRGPAAELLDRLDRRFLALARAHAAEPIHALPLWRSDDLRSFGYDEHSPSLLRVARAGADAHQYWQNAVCNNIWRSLAGREFGESLMTFTARGTCCRHEGRHEFALEYLRAFSMRELVAIGSPEAVLEFRERAMDLVAEATAELGLRARLELANDPFFLADGDSGDGTELPEQVKFELRLPLYDDRSLACASFNVHGDFFARRFGYRRAEPGKLWTACVAFGLERWVWAVLVQHGPDPQQWPAPLREDRA